MKHRKKTIIVLLLAWSSAAAAHEGGSHDKVMGTVRSIDEQKIVVKTSEGKDRTIRLDEDTECADESGDASCTDVHPGDHAVIMTRGKEGTSVADEIRFSSGTKKTSEEPEEHGSLPGHEHSHEGEDE
jgi:hypothetical protein